MYTVSSAALTLGVSITTMRRWMRKSGVGRKIATDKVRVYITYDELAMLAFKHERKMEKEAQQRSRLEQEEGQVGEKLYSVVETARLLNVSVSTVRAWLLQSRVEKRVINTDRKRVYVAYSDILMLANDHRVADLRVNQNMRGLYSVEDMSLLFGVTADTVKTWIKQSTVKKDLIETKCPYCKKSKRRVYVSAADVHLLAEQYRPAMSDVDIAAYIEEVRRNLAKIKRLKYD